MFTLSKKFPFEASHQLPSHEGKCSRLHGHSWVMTVTVEGTGLRAEGSQVGMLMDYGVLKRIVQPFVDNLLDHHHLNDTLGATNPTSEVVAMLMFGMLAEALMNEPVTLRSVTIEETCTSACTYVPEGF